jgi:hypothetical protein
MYGNRGRRRVPSEIEQASALTRFAVEARYSGDIEPITPEEVAFAIEMAERAVGWAWVQIRESLWDPVNRGPIGVVLLGHSVLFGRYLMPTATNAATKNKTILKA